MIIRRRHTRNFTTISNTLFDDERLAADEVGVLAYLLSRPDNWEIRRPALARRWGIGPVSIKRIVRAWMAAGWCTATKVRLPNGTFCILYDISDLPGEAMTEDEIREALSLVSSEASSDDSEVVIDPDNHPHVSSDPPPSQPLLADQRVVTGGVAIEEGINTNSPRDESYQNSERELARAREKHAIQLAEFKRRYPTAASDDQAKIDEEWFKLELDQSEPALAGIVPFLEKLKRDKRTTTPAAWKYLREKRWTLLEQATGGASPATTYFAPDSPEAKAIEVLHDLVGRQQAFRMIWRRPDGAASFSKSMTPQLLALASVVDRSTWATLTHQQAGAWETFAGKFFDVGMVRQHFREGSRAPHQWPPKVDGTWSATGPPESYMSEQDEADAVNFR